jgi:Spy/CpxP family protein refolding chaperone
MSRGRLHAATGGRLFEGEMKRAVLVSTVALLSPLSTFASTAADAPLPRDPAGGCGTAFQLQTFEEADAS